MSLIRQSDYESYDYREFWQDNKRLYEDQSERLAVRKLLGKIDCSGKIFIDLGCGFGRLFNEYSGFEKIILVDYSLKNVENAKNIITNFLNQNPEKLNDVYFFVADINSLPFRSDSMDIVLTVRVIHHLLKPEVFFTEVNRVIKDRGYFVLEFANKKNLKNILRFFFGMLKQSPFNLTPFKIGDTILNFHPLFIRKLLEGNGFKVLKQISVSNFRLTFIKKIIVLKLLLFLENIYQNLFSFAELGPSIFYKANYLKDISQELFLDNANNKCNKRKIFSDIREILLCPSCRQDKLEFLNSGKIYCPICKRNFKIVNNIYNFKI